MLGTDLPTAMGALPALCYAYPMKLRLSALAAFCLVWGTATAQEIGFVDIGMVSKTMGVHDGRICTGEFSRGDFGCASNAPYVSRTSGWVGIGTSSPTAKLEISGGGILIQEANGSSIFTGRVDSEMDITQSATSTKRGLSIHPGVSASSPLEVYYRNNAGALALGLMLRNTSGYVGVGTNPYVSLHVSGTIRMADGGEACDTNRAGAIKWNGTQFQVCYGSGGWAHLSSAAVSGTAGTSPDRIVSGTTSIAAAESGSLTFVTGGSERIKVGTTGLITVGAVTPTHRLNVDGNVLTTRSLYVGGSTAYGMGGANGESGHGIYFPAGSAYDDVRIVSTYNGAVTSLTIAVADDYEDSIYIEAGNNTAGNGGIGTVFMQTGQSGATAGRVAIGLRSRPSSTLHVSGTAMFKTAANDNTCSLDQHGALRFNDVTGRLQICRSKP